MTSESIDVGALPNDGTGDPLRTAFQQINTNFTELDAALAALTSGVGGTTGQVPYSNGAGALAVSAGLVFDGTNKALTIGGATVTASAPVVNASQTWNNAAVDFDFLVGNVTNSASGVGSNLLNLKIDGTKKFTVRKSGAIHSNLLGTIYNTEWLGGSDNYGAFSIIPNNAAFIFSPPAAGGAPQAAISYAGVVMAMTALGIGSTNSATLDLWLVRDAANKLGQRNGGNAQTSRIYKTWTNASNYQRLALDWSASTALVMNEGAGTGADGSVAFNDAALATGATKGFVMIPSCAGTPTGVPDDIPAGQVPIVFDTTNNKLYAYDGGWLATAALT